MLIAATGPNLFWQIVIFVVGVPLMLLVLWVAVLPILAITGLAIPHVPSVLRNLWRNRRSVFGSAGFVGGFWFVPDLVGRWIPTQLVHTFMEERDWADLPGGDFLTFFWTLVWFLNAVPYGLGVLAGCACIGSLLALIPWAADRLVYRGGRVRGSHENEEFSGDDFSRKDLRKASFEACQFEDVVFDRGNLEGATFKGCGFRNCSFKDANLNWVDLSGSHFEKADFSSASLYEATFTHGHLTQCSFRSANLSKASLSWTHVRGSDFTGAVLTVTDFRRARITDSILHSAVLPGRNNWFAISPTTFRGASLFQINLEGLDFSKKKVSLRRAELEEVSLRGATLDNVDMDHCKITNCDLSGASFRQTRLESAKISFSRFSYCDFSFTRLGDAKISDTDLTGADLKHISRITGFRWGESTEETRFTRIQFDESTIWPPDFDPPPSTPLADR